MSKLAKKVMTEFGDNGTKLDDTFALSVDGQLVYFMPAYRGSLTKSLTLSDGKHDVALRGITTPDAIGTYFINISGMVSTL